MKTLYLPPQGVRAVGLWRKGSNSLWEIVSMVNIRPDEIYFVFHILFIFAGEMEGDIDESRLSEVCATWKVPPARLERERVLY